MKRISKLYLGLFLVLGLAFCTIGIQTAFAGGATLTETGCNYIFFDGPSHQVPLPTSPPKSETKPEWILDTDIASSTHSVYLREITLQPGTYELEAYSYNRSESSSNVYIGFAFQAKSAGSTIQTYKNVNVIRKWKDNTYPQPIDMGSALTYNYQTLNDNLSAPENPLPTTGSKSIRFNSSPDIIHYGDFINGRIKFVIGGTDSVKMRSYIALDGFDPDPFASGFTSDPDWTTCDVFPHSERSIIPWSSTWSSSIWNQSNPINSLEFEKSSTTTWTDLYNPAYGIVYDIDLSGVPASYLTVTASGTKPGNFVYYLDSYGWYKSLNLNNNSYTIYVRGCKHVKLILPSGNSYATPNTAWSVSLQ